jgi:predicted N-acyltransferase
MWADVASQLKQEYYPKLIGMSPATPAVGYRFLIDPDEDEIGLTAIILQAIDHFCEQNDLSGCSFHFVDDEWKEMITSRGYSAWLHQSYEWRNQDFTSFDDYLNAFTKNQRRNIRRERTSVRNQGIEIRAYTGDEIPERFFPVVYNYYKKTNDQFGPWAAKFLNRRFFNGLYPGFTDRLLIMAAFDRGDSNPMGMSFLLTKGDSIIGRYWGASRWADSLHFEACYYSPIEWAIEHGVKRFDPGAGSPHKLRRGFFAIGNYSLHKFRDPVLRNVMETYVGQINDGEKERIKAMNHTLPLKTEYLPDY